MPPTTTRPWVPDPMDTRPIREVHRRWPTTTVYVVLVAVVFVLLCLAEAAR